MNKRELIKHSVEKARKMYPDGFNKSQLVEISKQIIEEQGITDPINFGKIKNDDDIVSQRSNMIQGNYPASISDCEVVGINGDCGIHCPVFKRGDCKNEEMMKII